MLPRPPSARQMPVGPAPPARPIGVGIDTSRYGHYAAFLGPDLQTAAPDLDVIEPHARPQWETEDIEPGGHEVEDVQSLDQPDMNGDAP